MPLSASARLLGVSPGAHQLLHSQALNEKSDVKEKTLMNESRKYFALED